MISPKPQRGSIKTWIRAGFRRIRRQKVNQAKRVVRRGFGGVSYGRFVNHLESGRFSKRAVHAT